MSCATCECKICKGALSRSTTCQECAVSVLQGLYRFEREHTQTYLTQAIRRNSAAILWKEVARRQRARYNNQKWIEFAHFWEVIGMFNYMISMFNNFSKIDRQEALEKNQRIYELSDLLEKYVETFAGIHDSDDCPQDDTCECEYVVRTNKALRV